METCPREGVMKEKFQNTRKPSHWRVCGKFWNPTGQHNQEGKKKKPSPEIMHLTETPCGKVAQMLTSATSERGLKREVQAALLKVRTGPECLEDNLRELT